MTFSDLSGYNFKHCDLTGSSLKFASLSEANIKNTILKDVDMEGVDIRDIVSDKTKVFNFMRYPGAAGVRVLPDYQIASQEYDMPFDSL